jgi:ATP-dependent Lhr-like helicase
MKGFCSWFGHAERTEAVPLEAPTFSLLTPSLQQAIGKAGFIETTPPQAQAFGPILAGDHVLLIAPTGSGKTEAALLPVLDQFLRARPDEGIAILYITPLRALNRDLLKRLAYWAAELKFRVEIRHGDTPAAERRRQSAEPPDFLVTTPETLQAILPGRRLRQHLRHVRWVVVDEIHQLAGERRGVQLTLGLERLRQVTEQEFQRIGLSATVGNPEEIAQFLGGSNRTVRVVQVPLPKGTQYFVEFPYPTEEDHARAHTLYTAPEAAARIARISELVDGATSTLVFVNSRQNAEMLGAKFAMFRKDIGVHHGSLPREERMRVEGAFRGGELKGLVCTSTLELGIDIGSIEATLQYMSPRQVTSLIQRTGRSGHRLDRTSRGTVVAVSTDDVIEAVAAVRLAQRGEIEPMLIPTGALDVLAHQIVGCLLDGGGRTTPTHIYELIQQAMPYQRLPRAAFDRIVDFLVQLRQLRRETDTLVLTNRGRTYYFENLSMIPDERRYPVIDVTTQQPVGILGEEFMLLRARVGLNFIVRGRVWKIRQIAEDGRVYVLPVEDPTAAVPGWDGELLPVPFELAQATGRLRREVAAALAEGDIEKAVVALKAWPAERYARRKVVEELQEHLAMAAPLPHDQEIVFEGFDRYLIVHACFGERVNDTLGELFEELLMRRDLVRFWWRDGYRILFELTVNTVDLDLDELVDGLLRVPEDVLEGALKSVLHRHFPFGYYMKFIAERMGVLRRGLFMGSGALKELSLRFRLTPVYEETLREAQQLHVDFPRVRELVRAVKAGTLRVTTFKPREHPTPLAYHILNRFAEAPELMAPETVARDNVARMRLALEQERVNLLCFSCAHRHPEVPVHQLAPEPRCEQCHAGLLGVVFWSADIVHAILTRKRAREKLSPDEEKLLVKARRSADLVLAYGKKAIVAQCVYGIGPQTAAKLLAKMHDSEDEFYRDLLEAKLKFITTRPFWDRGEARAPILPRTGRRARQSIMY